MQKVCARCGSVFMSVARKNSNSKHCSVECRFWSKVDMSDGPLECWLWTGRRKPAGYGSFVVMRRTWIAHRLAWTLTRGPIPDDLHACHKCDNPPCVNPEHLFLGTDKDNAEDRMRKGRDGAHKRRGDEHYSNIRPELVTRGDLHYARLRPDMVPRGEQRSQVKLTDDAVRFIRSQVVAGARRASLAAQFNVSKGLIDRVVQRLNWKHVE